MTPCLGRPELEMRWRDGTRKDRRVKRSSKLCILSCGKKQKASHERGTCVAAPAVDMRDPRYAPRTGVDRCRHGPRPQLTWPSPAAPSGGASPDPTRKRDVDPVAPENAHARVTAHSGETRRHQEPWREQTPAAVTTPTYPHKARYGLGSGAVISGGRCRLALSTVARTGRHEILAAVGRRGDPRGRQLLG